jgi:hypothetical protein
MSDIFIDSVSGASRLMFEICEAFEEKLKPKFVG